MIELSEIQLQAFTGLINQLSGTIGLTASEAIGQSIAFEALQTERVEVQELLATPPLALSATFNLDMPDKQDCLLLLPEECIQRFMSLATGDLSDTSIYSLSEKETAQLNDVAISIVRGFALGLGNLTNEHIEVENCAVALGEVNIPPVFASEEYAVSVLVGVSIPNYVDSTFTFMFTPHFVHTVTPEEGDDALSNELDSNFLDEDSIAGMLNELETMGKVTPASSFGGGSHGMGGGQVSSQNGNSGRGVDLILDISLDVTVELGRVRMLIKDVLELASGSIIELDRVAGEPVDVLVNGRLIAKGEVVVIEDNFGIRLTEIISPSERAMGLGRR